MPDLLGLNTLHFFSTIFDVTCSDTPHIRPISHPLITICLRSFIGGWEGCYLSDAEVKAVVRNYFQKLDKNFYAPGISKLFNHYEKGIGLLSDYVEE